MGTNEREGWVPMHGCYHYAYADGSLACHDTVKVFSNRESFLDEASVPDAKKCPECAPLIRSAAA